MWAFQNYPLVHYRRLQRNTEELCKVCDPVVRYGSEADLLRKHW